MKTVRLIGGMSWESSALYYRLINAEIQRSIGDHHNALSLMIAVDFAEVERSNTEASRMGESKF